VNCSEARLAFGAEPQSLAPALLEHLRGCPACAAFQREMTALDRDVRRALELPVPVSGNAPAAAVATAARATVMRIGNARRARAHAQSRIARPARWALAASVLLAVAAGALLWSAHPSPSLAADVVKHVEDEPQSWSSTARPAPVVVAAILARSGVALVGGDDVVYARSCWFRGHYVPHLVVRTARGRFTVMILPTEHVRREQHFSEHGYSGVLVPAPHGALAVLGHSELGLDQVVAQTLRSVRWTSANER